MKKKTIGTMFSGGEGVGLGAKAAGLELVWGIERDDDIAAVNRKNMGGHCVTADVTRVEPTSLARVDILHASTPCPSFSVAKSDRKEEVQDTLLAETTCDYIVHSMPEVFTLENVYGYRKSNSWRIIRNCLTDLGYGVAIWNINAADYGVPQTRRRMIVVARRDGVVPQTPAPTHVRRARLLPLVETRLPWVGWYEAIEDISHTLPPDRFAPWQLKLIPKDMPGNFVANGQPNYYGTKITVRKGDEPFYTVAATDYKRPARAQIDGRVVSMTPRARARFQTLPDWYQLPDSNELAMRIVGNAVPPLLYQRMIEGFIQ